MNECNRFVNKRSSSQFAVFRVPRSHEGVNADVNQRKSPSDEDEDSHRNIVSDEDNDEHEMKMNALAEHPEVIAEHQILRQHMKHNAPVWILAYDFGR